MRSNVEESKISVAELIFFVIGVLLLLATAVVVANGQSEARTTKVAKPFAQAQQPLYREYRGVHLGMTATEVRKKLGEPALKTDEQDYYVISATEAAQFAYDTAQKVTTISTDYTNGVGAPDYKSIVGAELEERPNGSLFRMVIYGADRFWVSYNKSATTPSIITITISASK